MKVYILLSKSKVHGVYSCELIANDFLLDLRNKCGLVPGYDSLWKKEYRIEIVELDEIPSILIKK